MLLENQYSLTVGDIPYTAGPPWRNEWTIILPTLVKNPLLHKNDIWDWNLVVYLSLKKKCEFRFLRWKTVLHHSHTKAKEFPNWSTPESSFIVKPHPYPGTETGIRLFVNIHLITCKFHLQTLLKAAHPTREIASFTWSHLPLIMEISEDPSHHQNHLYWEHHYYSVVQGVPDMQTQYQWSNSIIN